MTMPIKMKNDGSLPVPNNWEMKVEDFRSKFFYKSLDAVLTAPLRPRQKKRDYVRTVLDFGASNYDRVAAGTNLVNAIIPGSVKKISAPLRNTAGFPLPDVEVELMSYGSGSTVFLLKQPGKKWVLKVYRRSLGKKGQSLDQIANHFKTKYQKVCSWYNDGFDLVPPAHFLLINGPIFGSPAAAVLQKFIDGRKHDLFLDFTDEDILHLMEKNSNLLEQFLYFIKKTLSIFESYNKCFDFLGRENLMLVKNNDNYRLLVIDYGIFHIPDLMYTDPQAYNEIQARLVRLHYLQEKLS